MIPLGALLAAVGPGALSAVVQRHPVRGQLCCGDKEESRCAAQVTMFHIVILFQASEGAAVDYGFALASCYGSTWPQQDHNAITWAPDRRRALASGQTPLQQSDSAERGASPLSSTRNPSGLWRGSM